VIVEDQNARIRPRCLAKVVRRRQPADAAADDDEVVLLAASLAAFASSRSSPLRSAWATA
jgi:hypothetical protein